MYMKMKNGMKP